MVQAINELDGTVNKFIGDAILVYFEGENSCSRAVETSLKMISNSNFDIGVGISHGTLLAGLIGCEARLEYSIIGSVVNKAARLESACKELGVNTVIGYNTAIKCDYKLRLLEPLKVKGKEKPLQVYTWE